MVYVLGVPTHLAVGTDLFEIIISASYGTFSHALKGNVDILIALVMQTGAAIGAQIGAISTQYFAGPKIRLALRAAPADRRRPRPLHAAHRAQTLAAHAHPHLQRRHRSRRQPDAARRTHRRTMPLADHTAWHCRGSGRRGAAPARARERSGDAQQAGGFPEIVVRSGEPIRQILAETTANEYDLAIIGARRKGTADCIGGRKKPTR